MSVCLLFPHMETEITYLSGSTPQKEWALPSAPCRGYTTSVWPTAGVTYRAHLSKVLSASLLHCKAETFPFN